MQITIPCKITKPTKWRPRPRLEKHAQEVILAGQWVLLRNQSHAWALACPFREASIASLHIVLRTHKSACLLYWLVGLVYLSVCAERTIHCSMPITGAFYVERVMRWTLSHLDSNVRKETGSGSNDVSLQTWPPDFIPGAHCSESDVQECSAAEETCSPGWFKD